MKTLAPVPMLKRSSSLDTAIVPAGKRRRVAPQAAMPRYTPTGIEDCKVLAVVSVTEYAPAINSEPRRDSFILLPRGESHLSILDITSSSLDSSEPTTPSGSPRTFGPCARVWLWELRDLVDAFHTGSTIIREVSFDPEISKFRAGGTPIEARRVMRSSGVDLDWIYAVFETSLLYVALESHEAPREDTPASSIRGVSTRKITKCANKTQFSKLELLGSDRPGKVCIFAGSAVVDITDANNHICTIDLWTCRSDGLFVWPNTYVRTGAREPMALLSAGDAGEYDEEITPTSSQ